MIMALFLIQTINFNSDFLSQQDYNYYSSIIDYELRIRNKSNDLKFKCIYFIVYVGKEKNLKRVVISVEYMCVGRKPMID